MSVPTLVTPYGYSSSSCGYCTPSGSRSEGPTSKKYGMEAPQMSCQFYQNLIDRGWRRSGDYVYHPDMARTCCPQYTIRLDIQKFAPAKKHRQVINRWNRFLTTGVKPGDNGGTEHVEMKNKGTQKGKGKGKVDHMAELSAYEVGIGTPGIHKFETELVPAKATKETFELYKRYQVAVHHDTPEKVTMRGYSRFLCDSPLTEAPIQYTTTRRHGLPSKYGSYNLLYRVDGKLVGISVIDILPSCVSSVYFIWDPDWAWASLGKLSALREVALARDIRAAGADGMGWVYMGYWIAGCVKMRYKGEYSPSYLLDPGTNVFHPLLDHLDQFFQNQPKGYTPFTEIEIVSQSTRDIGAVTRDGEESADVEMQEFEQLVTFPATPPPGFADPTRFTKQEIDGLLVLMKGRKGSTLVSVEDLSFGSATAARKQISELAAALGLDMLAKKGMEVDQVRDRGILFFG